MKITKGTLRKSFWKYGCSGALFFTLDQEYGYPKENEERATGSLTGGFMQTGNSCGMIWGASLGAGAEAYRKIQDPDQAAGIAIDTTQRIIQSYIDHHQTPNCREVTGCNPGSVPGLIKYFLLGKPFACVKMGIKWAPEALKAANEDPENDHKRCKSCATETVRKMGGSEEEAVIVSGFAGGLGLSGNVCGALAAAIWLKTLRKVRRGESISSNPEARSLLSDFKSETKDRLRCDEITGKQFKTTEEHTEFVSSGGCQKLMEVLEKSCQTIKEPVQ